MDGVPTAPRYLGSLLTAHQEVRMDGPSSSLRAAFKSLASHGDTGAVAGAGAFPAGKADTGGAVLAQQQRAAWAQQLRTQQAQCPHAGSKRKRGRGDDVGSAEQQQQQQQQQPPPPPQERPHGQRARMPPAPAASASAASAGVTAAAAAAAAMSPANGAAKLAAYKEYLARMPASVQALNRVRMRQ